MTTKELKIRLEIDLNQNVQVINTSLDNKVLAPLINTAMTSNKTQQESLTAFKALQDSQNLTNTELQLAR